MIKVKKALMGGYKEDESSSYTHLVLDKYEYDDLTGEKDRLAAELDKYKTAWRKTDNENTELIEKYNILVRNYNELSKDNENIKKENKFQSEELELYKEKCTKLQRENETLIRIHREKSNAQRELIPKKAHNGYLFLSGKKTKFKFFEGFKDKECYLYKFQTPYDICLSYNFVLESVFKDLKERILKDLKIQKGKCVSTMDYFKNIKLNDLKELWENQDESIIFNLKLIQNGLKGFWELELNSRDEIIINNSVLGNEK
jgi:hypothetical protein